MYGPAMGKKCIIFIDDLNLPQMDESGTIPPVELLRQWIDHGYWYDKKDRTKVGIDINLWMSYFLCKNLQFHFCNMVNKFSLTVMSSAGPAKVVDMRKRKFIS